MAASQGKKQTSLRVLVRLLCKREKICSRSDAAPLEYFLIKNDGALMHPDSAKTLLRWLTLLAEKGEKETLRQLKKEHRQYVKDERLSKRREKDKKSKQPGCNLTGKENR